MWDNPEPPVETVKINDLNIIRREGLVYLTQCILGKSSAFALMRSVNELGYPLIPRKSKIVHKAFIQMDSLSTSSKLANPKKQAYTNEFPKYSNPLEIPGCSSAVPVTATIED